MGDEDPREVLLLGGLRVRLGLYSVRVLVVEVDKRVDDLEREESGVLTRLPLLEAIIKFCTTSLCAAGVSLGGALEWVQLYVDKEVCLPQGGFVFLSGQGRCQVTELSFKGGRQGGVRTESAAGRAGGGRSHRLARRWWWNRCKERLRVVRTKTVVLFLVVVGLVERG